MNTIGLAGFSNISSLLWRFSRFRLPFNRVPPPPPPCCHPPLKRRPQESLEQFRARRKVFVQQGEIRMMWKRRWDQSMRAIDDANAKLETVPKARWIRAGEFTEAYGAGTVAQGKRRRDGFDQEAFNYGVDDSRPALVKRCCLPVSQQRDFLTDVNTVFSWDEAERVEREGKQIVKEVMEYGWWMDRERDTASDSLTTRLRLLRLDGSIPQPLIPRFFPAHRDASPSYPTLPLASVLPAVINAPSSIGCNKASMEYSLGDDDTKCFRARLVVSKAIFLQERRYRRRRLDDQLKLRGYLNDRHSPLKVLERRRRRRHIVKHDMIKRDSPTAGVFSWGNLQSALLELVDETVLGTDVNTGDIDELQDMFVEVSDDYSVDSGDTTLVQEEGIYSLYASTVSSPASFKKHEIVGTGSQATLLFDCDVDVNVEAGVISEGLLSVYNDILGHEANNILTDPSSTSDGNGLQVNHSVLEPGDVPSGLHSDDMACDLIDLDTNMDDLDTEACLMVVDDPDDVATTLSDASHTPTMFGTFQGMVARLSDISHLCATAALRRLWGSLNSRS